MIDRNKRPFLEQIALWSTGAHSALTIAYGLAHTGLQFYANTLDMDREQASAFWGLVKDSGFDPVQPAAIAVSSFLLYKVAEQFRLDKED